MVKFKYGYFVFALPLLLIAFLFCGCGQDNTLQTSDYVVEFECPEIINMRMGTTDTNNEVALAPLYSNVDLSNCIIEYDDSIISYDANTGIIRALKSGSTQIKVTAGDKVDIIDVVVDQAIYCTSLTFNATDKILLGKTAELKVNTNAGYNMGLEYVSLDPDVLTIDENGIITPVSLGYATIKVIAKSAVDDYVDLGYRTIWATKTVQVVEERQQLNIEILDSNLEPLEYELDEYGIINYNLFSTPNQDLVYVIKLSSDKVFDSSCYVTESTTANDCTNTSGTAKRLWSWTSNFENIVVDSNYTLYRPFYAVDSGVDYFQESVLEVGMNFNNTVKSQPIKINVYKQTQDLNYTVYQDETCDTEYNLMNTKNEYILDKSSKLFVRVNLDEFAIQNINYDFNNINCEATKDGFLISSSGVVGSGYLVLQSVDGSNITKVIKFYNDVENITIQVEDTSANLALNNGVAGFKTNYAVFDVDGNLLENQRCFIEFLDASGNEITLSEDTVIYEDVTYKSFTINFYKSGTYYFRLVSENGYLSQIITVSIF